MNVTTKDISDAVFRSELAGRALCVHSSFRSFGGVEGGPQAVIDGLLEPGCTVMAPTFSDGYTILAPDDDRPPRNGLNYDNPHPGFESSNKVYSPDMNKVNSDMGVIPATLVTMDGRVRSGHPLSSFSAVGPKASELIKGHELSDVYGPLRKLIELDGFIVLIGVGLTRMTAIHLAEQMAGRQLFIRWVNGPDGEPVRVEDGSCSEGFHKLNSALESVERRITVGESLWRIFPSKTALEMASEVIRDDPMITHCDDAACERCDDMVAGGPIL